MQLYNFLYLCSLIYIPTRLALSSEMHAIHFSRYSTTRLPNYTQSTPSFCVSTNSEISTFYSLMSEVSQSEVINIQITLQILDGYLNRIKRVLYFPEASIDLNAHSISIKALVFSFRLLLKCLYASRNPQRLYPCKSACNPTLSNPFKVIFTIRKVTE